MEVKSCLHGNVQKWSVTAADIDVKAKKLVFDFAVVTDK